MHVIRTSFAFPAPLYDRLQVIARQRKLSLAQTLMTLLDPVLKTEEARTRTRIYRAFEQVQGRSKLPLTTASATIDSLLYSDAKEGK